MSGRHVLLSTMAVATALLAGCVGSPEGYKPGYEPRPAQETIESEEARAERLSVPVDVVRNNAYLLGTRKVIAETLGDIPTNPWNQYETDVVDSLGAELAAPHLPQRTQSGGGDSDDGGGGDDYGDDDDDDDYEDDDDY